MHGLIGGRLLKKLLRHWENAPVDAPAAEAENRLASLEERPDKSDRQQPEQTEDMKEPSAAEGEARG